AARKTTKDQPEGKANHRTVETMAAGKAGTDGFRPMGQEVRARAVNDQFGSGIKRPANGHRRKYPHGCPKALEDYERGHRHNGEEVAQQHSAKRSEITHAFQHEFRRWVR